MKQDTRVTLNQINRILVFLDTHDGITQYEALAQISVMRLASRISDMKKQGYIIKDEWVKGTNKYGEPYRVKKYWVVNRKELETIAK